MKPLILSFFVVLLGYSFFFDKENNASLRSFDQTEPAGKQSTVISQRADSISLHSQNHLDAPSFTLKGAKPTGYLLAK